MCGGLPLSIVVLGRHVFGRDRWYWQSELEKFKDSLPGDIKRRLEISIDTLDNVEKQIFMDIACFFIGKSFTMAMTIWKGSGWRARHALERLKEKCLIEQVENDWWVEMEWEWESRDDGFVLRMHDHLRDLGREMANKLSHPQRVWHPQHLKPLELKGFRNILAQTKGRCFHSIFDESMGCRVTYFLGESEDGSDTSLLWLQLEYRSGHPLELNSDINSSIFSWIPPQNLQCLRIRNGCFRTLWQSDVQIRDTFLEENIVLPTTLNKLNVRNCRDLQRVAVAGDLTKLTRLTIFNCPALEELPNAARVSCFERFDILSCEKLQNISGVEELHASKHMKLCYCGNTLIRKCIQKLKSVPSTSMTVVGRAADGAESSLNRNLFCEGNIGVDAVIEIGTGSDFTSLDCPEVSSIIGCFVVVIDSSTS